MKRFKVGESYANFRRKVRAQVRQEIGDICSDDEACTRCDTDFGSSCQSEEDWALNRSTYLDSAACSSVNIVPDSLDVSHLEGATYESIFSSSESENEEKSFCDINMELSEWAVKFNISVSAINSLLSILKPHFDSLPSNARTLLKTPSDFVVQPLNSGGEYCHIGLGNGLRDFLTSINSVDVNTLQLQFNVDGLQLFKSSRVAVWPILCMVVNVIPKEPFVVGLFCGSEKPASAKEFLTELVSETCSVLETGVIVNSRHYSVAIHSFVCDAPARAFMKGIKSHSGYSSCEKCTQHGAYAGKVYFPYSGTTAPLRTDESFAVMADENHHQEICPIASLPVGCVSQFGLDYMHLVCLGVVRRFILYWKGPQGPYSVRLGSREIIVLSQRLLLMAEHMPVEFARKPRSLQEVLRWKATEFRQFLLYTGVVALNGILPHELYQHFLLLFVSVTILVSPVLIAELCDYAEDLLKKFVCDAGSLYGGEVLVYNVHCLLHLAADARNLGSLDEFSSFPFENKLGHLKKLVRKPQCPIQQIVRRLREN